MQAIAGALLTVGVAPAAALAATGGAQPVESPRPVSVACVAVAGQAACPTGRNVVVRGGRFSVEGSRLAGVTRVIFRGRPGRADDVAVRPTAVTARRLEGAVPRKAASGRLTLLAGARRVGVRKPVRVRRAPARRAPVAAPQAADTYFYGAERRPRFAFSARSAMTAQVELVREGNGDPVVRTWAVEAAPGQPAEVVWDGRREGTPAPAGRYRFRLAGEARAAAAPEPATDQAFAFSDHVFPIRGPHDLGQSATNNFGGPRNHKGQDMFAACGTPVVAARGGTVQFAGYHSAAGNYVVIDGEGTGVDYVYMHMRRAPLVKTGESVRIGQPIGEVGDSGRATGCHLHFELWSAPGWYSGGAAFDPLPQLRLWDAVS